MAVGLGHLLLELLEFCSSQGVSGTVLYTSPDPVGSPSPLGVLISSVVRWGRGTVNEGGKGKEM